MSRFLLLICQAYSDFGTPRSGRSRMLLQILSECLHLPYSSSLLKTTHQLSVTPLLMADVHCFRLWRITASGKILTKFGQLARVRGWQFSPWKPTEALWSRVLQAVAVKILQKKQCCLFL